VQPDGNIVVAGYSYHEATSHDFALARLLGKGDDITAADVPAGWRYRVHALVAHVEPAGGVAVAARAALLALGAADFEARVGAALFEGTSRRVRASSQRHRSEPGGHAQ
jgi:hypothetical protein